MGLRRKAGPAAEEADYTSLFALNAIRAPEIWKRLIDSTMDHDFEGTEAEFLAVLRKATGLKLKYSESTKSRTLSEEIELSSRGGTATWLDVLETFLEEVDWEAVLEKGRIRFIGWEEAPAVWRKLWKEQPRGK